MRGSLSHEHGALTRAVWNYPYIGALQNEWKGCIACADTSPICTVDSHVQSGGHGGLGMCLYGWERCIACAAASPIARCTHTCLCDLVSIILLLIGKLGKYFKRRGSAIAGPADYCRVLRQSSRRGSAIAGPLFSYYIITCRSSRLSSDALSRHSWRNLPLHIQPNREEQFRDRINFEQLLSLI